MSDQSEKLIMFKNSLDDVASVANKVYTPNGYEVEEMDFSIVNVKNVDVGDIYPQIYDMLSGTVHNNDSPWDAEARAYALSLVYQAMMEKYGDENFALGMVGYMMRESNFGNPGIIQGRKKDGVYVTLDEESVYEDTNSVYVGIGLGQWSKERSGELKERYIKEYKKNPDLFNDPKAMAQVEVNQLLDDWDDSYYSRFIDSCKADTVDESTAKVLKYFGGVEGDHLVDRQVYAKMFQAAKNGDDVYDYFTNDKQIEFYKENVEKYVK